MEDRSTPPLPPPLAAAGVRLADAPILLLVYFHQAMRAELSELRRMALVAAAESGDSAVNLVLELSRRFEFLKHVYKYHCTAEDEVIFHAMDKHVKNVACAYSLEHESIDALFSSLLHSMKALPGESSSQVLQEVAVCISTLQSSISRHMQKEEEQVFPLLMQHFSSEEQASLVWRFIGSIPIVLLEDLLPWMISFFSPNDKKDVIVCITKVIPEEKPLQEVLISWLDKCEQSIISGCYAEHGKGFSSLIGSRDSKDAVKVHSSSNPLEKHQHQKKIHGSPTTFGNNLLDGLHLWHGAIIKDLNGILGELHQIRCSRCFSSLDFIFARLKFLADIVLFYSKGMENFIFPHLNKLASIQLSPWGGLFLITNHIESIQQCLHSITQNGKHWLKFVETFCQEIEAFVVDVSKLFVFQEAEVLPIISNYCSNEMQQQLLYTSLRMMPLGLLKCAVTWFSSSLSEHESAHILHVLSQENSFADKSFVSLIFEWFYIGYSGKTALEKFERDLEFVFRNRCSFLCRPLEVDVVPSNIGHGNQFELTLVDPITSKKEEKYPVYPSFTGSTTTKMYEASYSSGVNLRILFPETLRILLSPKFSLENSSLDSICDEPLPVDLMFFFHKAVKRELKCLVLISSQLADNAGLILEFDKRFKLFRLLYEIHSDAEDELAFPALEAKGNLKNISHSYTIDHKIEAEYFEKIFSILEEMHKLHVSFSSISTNVLDQRMVKLQQLCADLHSMLRSMDGLLSDHVQREENELWSLFREHVSLAEQEKIIGCMLGRTKAEILQDMIPWLMVSLTTDERQAVMSLLLKVTKNTRFVEWLREWGDGEYVGKAVEQLNVPPSSADPLEFILKYLSQGILQNGGTFCDNSSRNDVVGSEAVLLEKSNVDDEEKCSGVDENHCECSECMKLFSRTEDKRYEEEAILAGDDDMQGKSLQVKYLLMMTQEDMEAALRRVSMDTSLDPERKSYVMQNLLMSRWIIKQQTAAQEVILNTGERIPEQHPSYRDSSQKNFGCKHYKRNCKVVASCCNHLYTCIRCHDELEDHSLDRRSVTKMMCMQCLKIQLIGPVCSTVSCNNLSMGRYYCRICKLFDDEREIYHCPYCNICRVGKGLGLDYFHCMTCNACMSRFLLAHTCREKCFEDKCPICHEDIFTSSSPVKALSCGHLMHSSCFQNYTCTNYTCPICSKSLGDMQVYFKMLDALLAEEKIPNEYQGRTQIILCNDCEKRGNAPFHWLYHKCPHCGSYNTRLL